MNASHFPETPAIHFREKRKIRNMDMKRTFYNEILRN
jgi:hypothetical protein